MLCDNLEEWDGVEGAREVQELGDRYISSVQLLICVQLFATPWNAACQVSLSITNSRSLLRLMSIESVMPSNHLVLCYPLLLLLLVFSTSGSFPMSRLYISGGQRIGISALASVLPMNTQDQFPLELTGWIYLQSKGLLWLINVDEWQKSTQHCKAIIL